MARGSVFCLWRLLACQCQIKTDHQTGVYAWSELVSGLLLAETIRILYFGTDSMSIRRMPPVEPRFPAQKPHSMRVLYTEDKQNYVTKVAKYYSKRWITRLVGR